MVDCRNNDHHTWQGTQSVKTGLKKSLNKWITAEQQWQQARTEIPVERGESDFQSYHHTIFKMSTSQPKITKHTENEESMTHSKEKERLSVTDK